MSRHSALVLLSASTTGGEWEIQTKNTPKPGPDEVLVKVHASGLNPVDWKFADANHPMAMKDPITLGFDGAGEVVELGEKVTDLVKGDRVLFQGLPSEDKSSHQQYAIVPASLAGKVPPNLSYDQAASIPACLITAANGLYWSRTEQDTPRFEAPWQAGNEARYEGESIVVLGGSSCVGQFTIQLAKFSGFSTIVTTTSPHNFDLVESLGATHPIDRSSPTLAADIQEALGGSASKVVYDAIAEKDTQELGWDILAPGGILILVLPPFVDPKKYSNKFLQPIRSSVYIPTIRDVSSQLLKKLEVLLLEGNIRPTPVEVLPGGLKGIKAGLDRLKAGAVSGKKLVVHPQENI